MGEKPKASGVQSDIEVPKSIWFSKMLSAVLEIEESGSGLTTHYEFQTV